MHAYCAYSTLMQTAWGVTVQYKVSLGVFIIELANLFKVKWCGTIIQRWWCSSGPWSRGSSKTKQTLKQSRCNITLAVTSIRYKAYATPHTNTSILFVWHKHFFFLILSSSPLQCKKWLTVLEFLVKEKFVKFRILVSSVGMCIYFLEWPN